MQACSSFWIPRLISFQFFSSINFIFFGDTIFAVIHLASDPSNSKNVNDKSVVKNGAENRSEVNSTKRERMLDISSVTTASPLTRSFYFSVIRKFWFPFHPFQIYICVLSLDLPLVDGSIFPYSCVFVRKLSSYCCILCVQFTFCHWFFSTPTSSCYFAIQYLIDYGEIMLLLSWPFYQLIFYSSFIWHIMYQNCLKYQEIQWLCGR